MSVDHELSRDADVDLGGIFANLWRRKGTILLAGLIATALAWAALMVIKSRYNAQVSILIQNSDAVLTRNDGTRNAQNRPAIDDQGVASQVELLRSRSIARKVIEQLNLQNEPDFDSSKPSVLDTFLGLAGLTDDNSNIAPADRVLETFYERLKVYQVNRARFVTVEFWAHDPKLAAKIANAITDEYVKLQEELKRGAAPDQLKQLETELNLQREKVLQAEKRVAEYKSTTGLLTGKDKTSLAEQDLSELSTELSTARGQVSQAKAKAQSVQQAVRSGALESAESVLQSSLIQRLRERQVALNAQLAELNTKLLPRHPSILGLRSQIANVENQVQSEMGKILTSLQAEVRVAEERERDLIARRNTLKSVVAREEEQTVELRALQREAAAEGELLSGYLVRFKEASSRQSRAFLPADAKVVSAAYPSTKSYFPKRFPILASAFFGSMLLASMLILATGVLSGAPRSRGTTSSPSAPRDRAPLAELLKAASISTEEQAQAEPTQNENKSDLMNSAYEAEKNPVQANGMDKPMVNDVSPNIEPEEMPEEEPKGVLSKFYNSIFKKTRKTSEPAAGAVAAVKESVKPATLIEVAKSLTMLDMALVVVITPDGEEAACGAVALSRLLASIGPAVVVDMTGEATTTRNMLGTANAVGVRDILAGEVSFAQAIHIDRLSDAHIIPTGNEAVQIKPDGAVVLPVFLDALRKTYKYVIIDAGDVSVAALGRFSTPNMGVVINALDVERDTVTEAMKTFMGNEFGEPVLMKMTPEVANAVGVAA